MKNIYILPTDKSSRLHFTEFEEELVFTPQYEKLDGINIYITSDEEIQVGDWCIDDEGIVKCTAHSGAMNHYYTKIILTTDQDLIKDGVQLIPDEFLEWFVKNPSCESVEVKCYSKFNDGDFTDYKIIIPKEEPKKETLEEAINSYVYKTSNEQKLSEILENAIRFGAKWQQEQDNKMYSEEDMNDYANYRLLFKKPIEPKEWFGQFKNK